MLSNKLFDELSVGQEASITRVVTPDDFIVFAHASGNLNPAHLPDEKNRDGSAAVAPAMWVGSLFSAVLGNLLPGAGTTYLSQTLRFNARAHIGELFLRRRCAWRNCDRPRPSRYELRSIEARN